MFKEKERAAFFILDRKKELPDMMGKSVISPLHYGETVEISLVRGIEGETFINGKRFIYEEKNVFLIPPRYLHTSVYRAGGSGEKDMIAAFHINIKELSSFIDLSKILSKDGHSLLDLAFRCENFDKIFEIVQNITNDQHSFVFKCTELLRLFDIISNQKSIEDTAVKYSSAAARFVDFVEEHYKDKLSLDSVAHTFGYNKQYFCKWFKKETGVTFNEFLNSVRIHHARAYLLDGYTVEESAALCGFSDPSYFTKVFKRYTGYSPKAYALRNTKRSSLS